ncbi:MAG: response regulator (plasmid) [Leptolyngbya sp. BL-A-14]
MKILLVEDDQFLTELLLQALTEHHYVVETAADGQVAWNLVEAFQYDLILLDVVLPSLSGIQFCQQLRARKNYTPIILLTSQDSSTHKVSGLDAGADDYVVKPFHLHELLARIRALLRRESLDRSPTLVWRGLKLNTSSCIVSYDGKQLSLTSKEYKLLELFLRNQQRIFSQSSLINHLWSFEEAPSENGVRAHIKGLRRKLKQVGCEDLIETIYGLGYRLKTKNLEDVESERPQRPEHPEHHQPESDELEADQLEDPQASITIPPEFANAWQRYRDHYRDRLSTIRQAVTALTSGALREDLRQQVVLEAHTLAGSLGSFGLKHASHACKQLETRFIALQKSGTIAQTNVAVFSKLVAAIEQAMSSPSVASTPTAPLPVLSTQPSRLLIVSDEASLTQQLVAEANTDRWHITTVNPTTAITILAQPPPDVVLLDLSVPETSERCFAYLEALTAEQPTVPVVVLIHQSCFAERVKIARLGVRAVLQKPIASEQILTTIAQSLRQPLSTEGKLLVVDDDPQLLNQLAALLQPWGFQVFVLSDPRQFWKVLEQTQPDLLILDLVMPELSGLDLCQVVRNDPHWESLPVVFLSANTDPAVTYQLFLAGANDYASKPIVGPELIARILNQLKRTKPGR